MSPLHGNPRDGPDRRALPAVDAGPAAAGRHAPHQQRRRRHQLPDAGARPAPPRFRLSSGQGTQGHRSTGPARRVPARSRRRTAQARPPHARHRGRAGRRGPGGSHGRRPQRGDGVHHCRFPGVGQLPPLQHPPYGRRTSPAHRGRAALREGAAARAAHGRSPARHPAHLGGRRRGRRTGHHRRLSGAPRGRAGHPHRGPPAPGPGRRRSRGRSGQGPLRPRLPRFRPPATMHWRSPSPTGAPTSA